MTMITPEMIAAGWAVLNRHKQAARIWKMGPGPGLTEVYEAMQKLAPQPRVSYDEHADVLYSSFPGAPKAATCVEAQATVLWRFDADGNVVGVTIEGAEYQANEARAKDIPQTPSDGEIYSLASFGGDTDAKDAFVKDILARTANPSEVHTLQGDPNLPYLPGFNS